MILVASICALTKQYHKINHQESIIQSNLNSQRKLSLQHGPYSKFDKLQLSRRLGRGLASLRHAERKIQLSH